MSPEPAIDSIRKSHLEYGIERLRPLCRAASPWEKIPVGELGGDCRSEIGDGHAPYEPSIAPGDPELRILLEAQGTPPGLESNRDRALILNKWLAREFEIDFERFSRIFDLFPPNIPQGVFAIWYAASFWPGKRPEFKLYLNLQVRDRLQAPATMEVDECDRLIEHLAGVVSR